MDGDYVEINPYSEHAGLAWRKPDPDAPIYCPRCGTTLFECVQRDYETSLRCPTCRIQFVVADG